MKHVDTAMTGAREIINMQLRAKIEATRITRDPFAVSTGGVMGEMGDPWWASHILLNNSSRLSRRDPESMVAALSKGLLLLGVTLSSDSIRTQMEDPSNLASLLVDEETCYLIRLNVPVMKGGSPPGTDDCATVMRRQKFVTIFSEGKDWKEAKDKGRRLNVEFISEAFAPHFISAIFVGSMRGVDYTDAAVCACCCLAGRLFADFGCSQVHTVVLEASHSFHVRDGPKLDVEESFLGLMLCPNDAAALEHIREVLGISGQTRRVLSWAGFVFEFSSRFDITNTKRIRSSHLVIDVWSLRVSATKPDCTSADMIQVLTDVCGTDVDFIFPKLSRRPASEDRYLSWVAGISNPIPPNSLRNSMERLCSLSLHRDNIFQPGTQIPVGDAAASDSFLHLDRSLMPTSRTLKAPAKPAAKPSAPRKTTQAAAPMNIAPRNRSGVEHAQVSLADWRSHGSSLRSKNADVVTLKARIAYLDVVTAL